MGDMAEVFKDWKEFWRKRRDQNFAKNVPLIPLEAGWIKHTEWHYGYYLLGKKLDYWPSRNKWMWSGKVYNGTIHNLFNFIENRLREADQASSQGQVDESSDLPQSSQGSSTGAEGAGDVDKHGAPWD